MRRALRFQVDLQQEIQSTGKSPTEQGHREWYNQQNRKSHGHAKRVTRLYKYLRDFKNTFTVASVAMTTLVGMAVEATDAAEVEHTAKRSGSHLGLDRRIPAEPSDTKSAKPSPANRNFRPALDAKSIRKLLQTISPLHRADKGGNRLRRR